MLGETEAEFRVFAKEFQRVIRDKIRKVAENLPTSLKLRSDQPIRGQEGLGVTNQLFELDVAPGPRVAFAVYHEQKLMVVYMLGTHDYAKKNYLKLAEQRLLRPDSMQPPSNPTEGAEPDGR